MTSPRRLLDDGTPFERDVLASARLDSGNAAGLNRTLAAMSLGAAAATAASSIAPGVAGIATGTAGSTATVTPASAGAGALVKWMAIALVVGTAITARAITWWSRTPAVAPVTGMSPATTARPPEPPNPPRPSTSAEPTTPDLRPAETAPRSFASMPTSDSTDRAVGMSASSNRPLASHAAAPGNAAGAAVTSSNVAARSDHEQPNPVDAVSGGPAAESLPGALGSEAHVRPASVLYAELAALARVRAALDRGDSRGALQSLAAYDSAFPASTLAEEATVLRIDALAQQEDGAAAAALGRHFLAANPASPYAPHVRRLIDGAHNP
jgi:hypothetical protein